jgi:hypothetical protein
LKESFASAQYKHSVRLRVALPAEEVPGRLHLGSVVEPDGPDACTVRSSADRASLVVQDVASLVALGADFTVEEATPETASLIAEVGEQLARSFLRR